MLYPCRNDEIVCFFLLQHAPHRLDIIPRVSPVAFRIQIPQAQFFIEPELDSGDAMADLACDEFQAAARRLMVKEDSAACKKAIALPVIDSQVMCVDFGDPIGTSRI